MSLASGWCPCHPASDKRSPAGVHALCHSCFGQALGLHLFFNLKRQYLFDGSGSGGFECAFFFQEVVEFASNAHSVCLSLEINPVLSELNISRWCRLRFFNEAMQEHHVFALHGKQNTGNTCWQLRPHVPYLASQLTHKWHTQRPAELYRFDVFANSLPLVSRQLFEPLTHRLCA